MSNNDTIEYGYADRNGVETWPDLDGDLYLNGQFFNPSFSDEDTLDVLLRAAAADTRGIHLIERIITRSESRPVRTPLPTAPGSVIRATVNGHTGIFGLDDSADGVPWYGLAGPHREEWYCTNDFTDVTVLFDAAEAR